MKGRNNWWRTVPQVDHDLHCPLSHAAAYGELDALRHVLSSPALGPPTTARGTPRRAARCRVCNDLLGRFLSIPLWELRGHTVRAPCDYVRTGEIGLQTLCS